MYKIEYIPRICIDLDIETLLHCLIQTKGYVCITDIAVYVRYYQFFLSEPSLFAVCASEAFALNRDSAPEPSRGLLYPKPPENLDP